MSNNKESKIDEFIMDIFDNGVSDNKIAILYYNACFNKFLWDEINENWYIINEYNIWEKDKKGNRVIYDMCESLNDLLLDKYSILFSKYKGNQKKFLLKNYSKSVNYLESNKNKRETLKELKGFCKTKKIFEKMDNVNPYLFAFDNGVYDLQNNIFRLPKPEELITCTCKYNYEEINGDIEKAMKDIHNIVSSMFSSEDDKNVILMEIAHCLNAVPLLEEFYIWKGKGRNGKGVLRDLIKYTFGDYYDPIDIEYFNQTKHGRSANAPDEIMVRKKNCRIVITTEPESDMKLKFNLIKMITGRDDIQCRHNFCGCFNFTPKFRLLFQTNYDIDIDNVPGQAKIQRIKIRNFPFVFLQNPVMEDHKLIDNTLKERIEDPIYKIAFFHVLLDYYNKWVKNGKKMIESKNFNTHTNKYLADSDPFTPFYQKFIDDGIIEATKNDKDTIKLTELFNLYKMFYEGENKTMTNKEFKSAVENKGFRVVLIHGYNLIRRLKINATKLNDFKMKSSDINFLDEEPTKEEPTKEEPIKEEPTKEEPVNQETNNEIEELKKLNESINHFDIDKEFEKLQKLESEGLNKNTSEIIIDNDLIIDHNMVMKCIDNKL